MDSYQKTRQIIVWKCSVSILTFSNPIDRQISKKKLAWHAQILKTMAAARKMADRLEKPRTVHQIFQKS